MEDPILAERVRGTKPQKYEFDSKEDKRKSTLKEEMKKEEPTKRVDISTSSSMQQSQKRQWTVDPVTNKPQTTNSLPKA